MKILYITNGINGSGGLERVLSIKASYFADSLGYEVFILSLNENEIEPFYQFSNLIRFQSIITEGNSINYLKSYLKGIQEVVSTFNPDIISVCDDGLKGFFLPRLIRSNAKWIYERHASIALNTNSSLKGRLVARLMKSQVRNFDAFVVLTNSNIEEWDNRYNVICIPNPLSFNIDQKSLLNEKRIIAVGSHSLNKGYDTLIRMWKAVEEDLPDWSLDVFGKIDKEKRFVSLAEKLAVKNIHFHIPVHDIKSEILKSSILVLPSRSEGFGMVLIEAMACGVPCVAFDCPSGPRDIITNGVDGFLINDQDEKSFIEQLKKLTANEDLRLEMGIKAQDSVSKYRIEEIGEEWDNLFKSL